MTLCNGEECDRYEPGEIVAPKLSVDGGGHEFVESLPDTGVAGIEYIVLSDLEDCSTFEGTFIYNAEQGCWVTTSSSGGGGGGNYTFEPTATGWVAKKNGNVIFTYNDSRITANATAISSIRGDIYNNYLIDRILADKNYFKLDVDATNPNAKTIKLGFKDGVEFGDKSDGAYKLVSGTLTSALGGTTPVSITRIAGIVESNIVVGETLIYDTAGTLGVVTSKTSGNVVVTTMTVSPGERTGVRLGTVDASGDLPATVSAAEALGWQTPLSGDYAYVRDYNGHLSDFVATVENGNITWSFSHYINAGDYVVDIYESDGTLIPKNDDGGVTLPVDNDVASVKLADGTELSKDGNRAVTLPDFGEIKGIRDHEGSLLPIDDDDKTVTLPDGGASDYEELDNLPSINDVELVGNKTIEDLDIISTELGNGLRIGEDGKLMADVQKGILSEGTVKGVRCTTLTQGSTAAGYKEVKFTYKDGNVDLVNSDGRLTATENGLYFYRIRPANFHSLSKSQTIIIQLNDSDVSSSGNNDSQIDYRYTQAGERPATISGVVKLSKGDILYTFYAISQTFSNDQVAAEFYKISERTDGLVAEAKYANQTFPKGVAQPIALTDVTDTDVFPGNGQIVLPEDGSYIISSDMVNGTNSVTSHTVRTYLHKDAIDGATVSFNTMPSAATVAAMNITHVVQGKKGDAFVLASLHDSYAYNYVRKATDDISGVRLFKMSFTGTGGGGGGGTTDYEELDNLPSINGVELLGDKTNNELGIFSKVDYSYTDEEQTLEFFANEGAGKELTQEHKTGETFNGKPVYEVWRTFTVPNSNSATRVGNVTDLNIDTMLEIQGMMNDAGHFIGFPDILASSGSFFGIMVRDFGTTGEYNVYIACAQATATFKDQPVHVKFKYTKK